MLQRPATRVKTGSVPVSILLEELGYGRRWLVECYNSALKRTTGSTLTAKTHKGRMIGAAMKVLAYALRR